MTQTLKKPIALQKIQPSHLQIFFIFFKLGCLSFGGPAAHLVVFHREFVQHLKWFDHAQYSQLVALSQIIPGPSSSQVGIAIGYLSRGYLGSISAWLGFTLPSFILMTAAGYFGQTFFKLLSNEVFHSLKLIVLAVIIFAFWQMLQSFCKAIWQYLLMLASALFIYVSDWSFNQIILIVFAGIFGLTFSKASIKKSQKPANQCASTTLQLKLDQPLFPAYIWLIVFFIPLIIFAILKVYFSNPLLQGLEAFYQSASMVFGGGHIILPLLHQDLVETGLISSEKFDLGYALAQLMPGPLFSFASYLGALLPFSDSLIMSAAMATIAIFMPSFFLIYAVLPYWSWLMNQPKIYQAVEGINAAVIGLLLCLVVEMTETNVQHWLDILFVSAVVLLLRSKLPIVISIVLSFSTYQFFIN